MKATREQRAERLSERAAKTRAEAAQAFAEGDKMASVIPFGQPILVGHYSEKRDRNYRAKINRKFDKAIELSHDAEELDRRAEAAANNTAIYADAADPVAELDARIAELEAKQETMKRANALVKKLLAGDERARGALVELLGGAEVARVLTPPQPYRPGYESFTLTNNSANIRRLKARREQLATLKAMPRVERTVGAVKVVENPDLARIQLFFPGKPDEATRSKLKAHGFRWAPSEKAWQRQLNANGRYAAEAVLKEIAQ